MKLIFDFFLQNYMIRFRYSCTVSNLIFNIFFWRDLKSLRSSEQLSIPFSNILYYNNQCYNVFSSLFILPLNCVSPGKRHQSFASMEINHSPSGLQKVSYQSLLSNLSKNSGIRSIFL